MQSNSINNNVIYGVFKNKITNKKLVYYPCPKNANSSAKLFFAKHLKVEHNLFFISDDIPEYKQDRSEFSNQNNLVNFLPAKQPFKKLSSEFVKCCIIRDPIDRFLSAYKNRILFHKDFDFRDLSIDDILSKLLDNQFTNKHFLPQSYFLGNDLKYYNFFSDLNNIKKFEENVNNFFNTEIFFPKIQTGGNNLEINLTKEQSTKIKKIYESDYLLINSV